MRGGIGCPQQRIRCYRCGGVGHIVTRCPGNEYGEGASAPAFSQEALPCTVLKVEGTKCRVLIDTGCSCSIVNVSCCKSWTREGIDLVTVSGEKWKCEGVGKVHLQLSTGASVNLCVSVTTSTPLGFKFILGMDGIRALREVTVDSEGGVHFGREETTVCAAGNTVVEVDEQDFSAVYDSVSNSWMAVWKWTGGEERHGIKWMRTLFLRERKICMMKSWQDGSEMAGYVHMMRRNTGLPKDLYHLWPSRNETKRRYNQSWTLES